MNPRRRLLLTLRRQLNPIRRFDVNYLNEGVVEFTCRECGAKKRRDYNTLKLKPYVSHSFLETKLLPLWKQCGSQGHCKRCTKKLRDERYPLPKEEK
jgi:hypothetical protein